jgi:NAD(P)H-hydrate epimerase
MNKPDIPVSPLQFHTDTDILVPAVTAEQMRKIDHIAIEETGPNLFQMMENAGRSLSSLAIEILGSGWHKARIVVLAGTGGNGGGGICAARHLANRNTTVDLCITHAERLEGVIAFQQKIFQSTSGKVVAPQDIIPAGVNLIIDAIIGYSLQAAPHGNALRFIDWANATNVPILSLDVPSGLDATTGRAEGSAVQATHTMTLALPKTGLKPGTTGDLFLADIGIPRDAYRKTGLAFPLLFDHRYIVPLRVTGRER